MSQTKKTVDTSSSTSNKKVREPVIGGKLMLAFVIFAFIGAMLRIIFAVTAYYEHTVDQPAGYRTDITKLPKLTADKKTLVVTSEDALPNAFEFLRLNMYLPIQKIVLIKPGVNDTVRVYPIPREGMIGLSTRSRISIYEIGLIAALLIFILGSFTYIFSNMSNSKVYLEDEGWFCPEELLDANDVSCDEAEDDKLLITAEKKRKEIETM